MILLQKTKLMHIKLTAVVTALLLLSSPVVAQQKKAAWPEMKTFHSFMASTFHPAEEGDLAPLKANADSLYNAAIAWQASAIPATFKNNETKEALQQLVKQCAEIKESVNNKKDDALLTKLITEAHDTFHHIVGECRKADE